MLRNLSPSLCAHLFGFVPGPACIVHRIVVQQHLLCREAPIPSTSEDRLVTIRAAARKLAMASSDSEV